MKIKSEENKWPLSYAQEIGQEIVSKFEKYSSRIEIAGSIRRQKSLVKDIEIVVEPKFSVKQRDLFAGKPVKFSSKLNPIIDDMFVSNFFTKYEKNGSRYKQIWIHDKIKLDLFIVFPPAQYGVIYLIRTGSANYSKQFMLDLKLEGKFKIENGALYQITNKKPLLIVTPTEKDVYLALGKEWIPPQKRK